MQGGARLGCAPWQLGQLAQCLLVFDIFVGRHDGKQEIQSGTLCATAEHVERRHLERRARAQRSSRHLGFHQGQTLIPARFLK